MKLLRTIKQEVLFAILLVLLGVSFYAKFNQKIFLANLINVLLIIVQFIYFSYYLKVVFNFLFRIVLFFFFTSSLSNALNASHLYSMNEFANYLPQVLSLCAYLGLTHYSLLRLGKFKFIEVTNLYLMVVLIINVVLTVVFVNIIIGNVNVVFQEYIIYVYCLVSIVLGFASFSAFNQDGSKASFLFIIMTLSFIFSDIQYALNQFLMSSIIFDIGDVILTAVGLYFMFRFIYEKQITRERLESK